MTRAAARGSLAGLLLAATLAVPANAAGERPIVVGGRIDNGTTGGVAPRGLRVEVAPVADDGTRSQPVATRVGADGAFRLPPLPRPPHVLVATRYRGVIYSTTFEPRPGRLQQVRLAVFEPTSQDEDVRVLADTTIVDARPGGRLEILHVLRVENRGTRTLVGRGTSGGRAVIRLPVPAGAHEVTAEEGTPGIVEMDDAHYSTAPLQPGTARLSFSYSLAQRQDDASWTIGGATRYPTRRVDFLLGPGLDVDPAPLRLLGELDFRGTDYRQYRVKKSQVQDLGLRLRPEADEDAGTEPLPVALAAALGVGVAAFAARSASRRRKQVARSRAVDDIAALDLAFEQGAMDADEYSARRADLKRRLRTRSLGPRGEEG